MTSIGCTSTLHDRVDCARAFCNDEIIEDEICPTCRAQMYRCRYCGREVVGALGDPCHWCGQPS